jgi:RNA polymerase sigma factor (sigma-70 family)
MSTIQTMEWRIGGPSVDGATTEEPAPLRSDDRIANNVDAEFASLYAAYWPALRRLATLMTGNADEGQDLAQEAFAQWYVHKNGVEKPEAYLRVVLLNLIRGRSRKIFRVRKYAHVFETEAELAEIVLPADGMADAVAKLPYRQRAAIVLKYYEGRTEAEIAQLLECRPGTVKSLVSRALDELRRTIEK